jgi:hypothetical protein
MRSFRLISVVTILLSTGAVHLSTQFATCFEKRGGLSKPDPAAQAKIVENYGKLPLRFEANHGQADARVKFLSRTSG